MNRILHIFINPFVVSLPVALLVILLLPDIFDKYKTELVDKQYKYGSKVYYYDLNNNSFTEYIELHYEGNKTSRGSIFDVPAIQVDIDCSVEKLPITIGQFNFTKKWFKIQKLYFGDFDNDGLKEIYFYTFRNDSLFLEGLDVFNRKKYFIETFICKFNYRNKFPDLVFGKICSDYDLNKDGHNEVIGSVIGAYSALPRFVFAYDIKNDTLIKGKTDCINLSVTDVIKDKNDNIYITGSNYAPGNIKDSMVSKIEFTDHSSWLVVMDKHLDFVFPPIENPGFTSAVNAYLKKENDEIYIYSFFRPPRGKSPSYLKKYNLQGVELSSKNLMDPISRSLLSKSENNNEVLYLYGSQVKAFYKIDEDLDFVGTEKMEYRKVQLFDLDFDGSEEIFNWQEGEEYAYIYTSDFNHPAKVEIKDLSRGFILSPCKFKDNSANFAIHAGDFEYYFKYFNNPVYYLQFPFYLGIYLLISFLFYIVMYFQRKSLQQKFEQEKKMTELELLTIKNQIDPHFTFNAINTLSSFIYKEDKKTAHEFLVDFSTLIRNTLNNSKKISTPLKDEIEFVENYLKLQQFRYVGKFDYSFQIDKNVDLNTMVPRMIIQTFAENSVKHGLVNKECKGKLEIKIHPITWSDGVDNPGRIQIEITDDGIGLKKSKQVQNHKKISTGHGHKIIKQIVEMYNRLNKTEVGFEISDLKDVDGKNNGTKVSIVI